MAVNVSALGVPTLQPLSPPQNSRGAAPSSQADKTPSASGGALDSVELSQETQNAVQAIERLNESQNNAGGLLSGSNPNQLSEEEKKVVEDLKQTDQKVRAHEQAHKTVGGQYAGAISYETVTGPDGREYAVAGEVQIDVSPVPNNPEATVRKMDVVIRAALAPAEPSPQDFAVARTAQQVRTQAQKEASDLREAEQAEARTERNDLTQGDDFDPNAIESNENEAVSGPSEPQQNVQDPRFVEAAINLLIAANTSKV